MKIKVLKILILISIIILSNYILTSKCYAFSAASSVIYEGIDVSGWQGDIDYAEVKATGIEVVYIKSSEGYSFIDPYFEQNYTNAKANGLKIGFYHYVTAKTAGEAYEQAKFFSNLIEDKEVDCRLAMDFENFDNLSRAEVNQIATVFMQTVQKLTGKEMILYSNTYSARSIFSRSLTIYPLWVAQYDVTDPTPNGKWNSWVGWQYTSQGDIPGVNGNVDRDEFTEEIFLKDNSKIVINNQNVEQDQSTINSPINRLNKIIVKWGDTLSQIAIEYNTTVSELATLNDIENPNLIYVGETIIIPTKEKNNENANNETEKTNTNQIMYKIQWGDTLWSISRRYGVSIATLVRLNKIKNPNLIYAGSYLKI